MTVQVQIRGGLSVLYIESAMCVVLDFFGNSYTIYSHAPARVRDRAGSHRVRRAEVQRYVNYQL